MSEKEPMVHHLAETGGVVLSHLIAVVLGLVLMVSGVGMGVTIVLLPLGIPVGLVGLLLFIWGLVRHRGYERQRA